jgi:hypothetical protein
MKRGGGGGGGRGSKVLTQTDPKLGFGLSMNEMM